MEIQKILIKKRKIIIFILAIYHVEKLKLLSEKEINNKNNKLFSEFNYNPKYIYLLSHSDEKNIILNEIKSRIKSKIKESYKEKDVSWEEILYLTSLKVGIELDYNKDYFTLEYASLKYFILELKDDYFKINYSFNYINNFIKEINLKKNIDNFYKYDKFSN